MTREEELDWLYRLRSEIYVYMPKEWLTPMNNALDMAIKDAEQPISGDCVSRQAVLETIDACNIDGLKGIFCSYDDGERFKEYIKVLPPVTPTQKWIPVSEELPKRNMPCLVAVGDFNLTQIAVYSDLMGTIDHKIFWQGDYGHDSFRDITKYVKAWLPLPKPYEEKRGSEDGSN